LERQELQSRLVAARDVLEGGGERASGRATEFLFSGDGLFLSYRDSSKRRC
jgi:hypothetical protein